MANPSSSATYFAYVYDPVNDISIYTSDRSTPITTPLVSIKYRVPKTSRTWVCGVSITTTDSYPLANIYHSIGDKHIPELCWKYPELSIQVFENFFGFGYGVVTNTINTINTTNTTNSAQQKFYSILPKKIQALILKNTQQQSQQKEQPQQQPQQQQQQQQQQQ